MAASSSRQFIPKSCRKKCKAIKSRKTGGVFFAIGMKCRNFFRKKTAVIIVELFVKHFAGMQQFLKCIRIGCRVRHKFFCVVIFPDPLPERRMLVENRRYFRQGGCQAVPVSEYMEKYAVSRMIGSPPGYVGYEEAGQLTEKVRRRPYSVVLFDEIEKAHPDVMNILLQILDEGKINDAQGRTVDFSNTVICMTSNAGSSDQSTGGLGFNKSEEQLSEEKTRKALAQFLRPEFLGRVDEVIAFKPLTEETLQGIAALMLDEYKPGMEAKGIAYSYTPAALKALVQKSQGGKFGARDLRRVIRKAVEDPAAERLIDGTLASGGTLVVDAGENGEIILK